MKNLNFTVIFIAIILGWQVASAETHQQNQSALLKDIKETLGVVPSFLKQLPTEALPGAWEDMKQLQLPSATALSNKEKQLIGLAVSAQIPCKYCVYFHTEAAKLNKASPHEIQEAITMAALTRKWSTVLNGNTADFAAFKVETDKIMANMKMKMLTGITSAPTLESDPLEIADSASAYSDINKNLGLIPNFLKQYPEAGIAGAWKEMKALQLSQNTALSGKTKELIGVAVAAQIPCQYCSYFHTQAAMVNGANNLEIQEAIAISSATRHWSTVLNGSQIDKAIFKKEVQRIIKHFNAQIKMRSASNN